MASPVGLDAQNLNDLIGQARAALLAQDDDRVRQAAQAISPVLARLEPAGVTALNLDKDDADVLRALRGRDLLEPKAVERLTLLGTRDDDAETLRRAAEVRATPNAPSVSAGAMSNEASVRGTANAAVSGVGPAPTGAPRPEDAATRIVEAVANQSQHSRAELFRRPVEGLLDALKPDASDKKGLAAWERLRAQSMKQLDGATKAEAEAALTAGKVLRPSPLFEKGVLADALALASDPNAPLTSKALAHRIEAHARTKGVDPAGVRKTLHENLKTSLESGRPEIVTQAKIAAQHNPEAVALIDRIAKGEQVSPEQLQQVLAYGGESAGLAPADPSTSQPSAASLRANGVGRIAPSSIDAKMKRLKVDNPRAAEIIQQVQLQQQRYNMVADAAFQEMVGVLNSGMPIEMVLIIFMAKMCEQSEEKNKLRLKEAAALEGIERENAHIEQLAQNKVRMEHSDDPAERAAAKALVVPERIDPGEYGLPQMSSQMFMQHVQADMARYQQMMSALSAVLKLLEDLVMTPIRNIR